MKRFCQLILVALIACTFAAASDARQSFDQLKALEGNWAGKGWEGRPVSISFRMTSSGSALMSEIQERGPENMVTMIHLDGDRLLLTHYRGAGNQPRMKLIDATPKSLTFEFFDGTNIGPGDGHMQRVTFTQPDATHQVEEWVFLDHGQEHTEIFTLEKTK
jgi:hypothetical protein